MQALGYMFNAIKHLSLTHDNIRFVDKGFPLVKGTAMVY